MLRQKHLTTGMQVMFENQEWDVTCVSLNTVEIKRDGITKGVTVHVLKLKDDGKMEKHR